MEQKSSSTDSVALDSGTQAGSQVPVGVCLSIAAVGECDNEMSRRAVEKRADALRFGSPSCLSISLGCSQHKCIRNVPHAATATLAGNKRGK